MKRALLILSIVVVSMVIIPMIAVNTVKADAGMLTVIVLFFAVNPLVSIWTGTIAGKDIKHLWFTPVTVAVLFWVFSSLTFKTAFPFVYSAIYFSLCSVSMLITWFVSKKRIINLYR